MDRFKIYLFGTSLLLTSIRAKLHVTQPNILETRREGQVAAMRVLLNERLQLRVYFNSKFTFQT